MSSSRLLCGVLLVAACSPGSVDPAEAVEQRFDDAIATARSYPDGAIEAELTSLDGEPLGSLDVDAEGASSLSLPGIAEGEPVDIFDATVEGVSVALYVQWKARAADAAYSDWNVCMIGTFDGYRVDRWPGTNDPVPVCQSIVNTMAIRHCEYFPDAEFFSTPYYVFRGSYFIASGNANWRCVDGWPQGV